MHDDFWKPFLFGASWLAAALAVIWLLRRAPEHLLALRSRVARILGAILAGLALAVFVSGLPFSLGFCRGGLDDPLTCSILPVEMVEGIAPLSLLLAIVGLVTIPVLATAMAILEAVKRLQSAIGHKP